MNIIEKLGITGGDWHEHSSDPENCQCGILLTEGMTGSIAHFQRRSMCKKDDRYANEYPTDEEFRANIRLCAAAPKMLEKLMELTIDWYDSYVIENGYPFENASEAAKEIYSEEIKIIEAATGRTWEEVKEMMG